jgi:hypothetical protein
MISNKKRLSLLILGASLFTAAQQASAFSSYESVITDYCSGKGYDLLPDYASNSCTACHNDSQGKAAYNAGNYDYFCSVPDTPTCTDNDGDGFYVEGESCGTLADFNDNSADAYPGAPELCNDGIDNDGNGLVDAKDPNAVGCEVPCTDMDMDGYATEGGSCGAIDCNDNDAAINPGAVEICTDGIDNNCNGLTDTADMNAVDCPLDCTDKDGDGYSIEGGSCGAVDCDDDNVEVNPGALENCGDGIDNNCNGLIDSVDGVCQNDDDDDDDECKEPWWRSKGKHRHDHKQECSHDDESDDESDEDESDEDDDQEDDDDSGEERECKRPMFRR